MLKKTLLILVTIINTAVFGQEICNNGIDDDGDGLIDCYDPDCSGNTACSDFFYGKPALSCTTNPTNPAFSLNTIWQSSIDVSTRSTMMVGDVDGDGIPEVVCHQNGVNQLYILDGQNGNLKVTINCPPIADHVDAIAIGDTDDDGLGEIYVVTSDNVLRCFENNGTPKVGFTPPTTAFTNESVPGIADFNQDGTPEIYKDNKIYNSLTGALIASGTGSTGQNPGSNGSPASLPVAADVLPDGYCPDCAGLELVCGNVVYAVNVTAGTITPVANSLPTSLKDGFTCVADMDLDGKLDVIVTSNGTIYVWDPRTGLQLGNTFSIPNTSGGGRANIADYDNDGLPEIGVGGMDRYVVIDVDTATNTLSQKWIKTIVDGSQHTTGSVFDFDCDGLAQVVYRDENTLFVWDGATGNVNASIQCGSATRSEFPTIVDVDGDGQVNIVCACATGNGGSAGKVKAFNSSTNQWVGSRKVMNQHSYSVVNINDDLSIPIQQQNHALLPKLNGFLAQSPIFDVNWSTTCIPLANANVAINSVIYCQKPDTVIVALTICNTGSKVTSSPLNVSVYNGNPLSGGILIKVFPLTTTVLPDSCSIDTISVPFAGTSATFYVYVNDNGTNPASAPETAFLECDSSNNNDFVLINLPQLALSITGDTSICLFDSTTLIASGATTYAWAPALGLNSTTGNIVIAHPYVNTTYTITGTDSVSGCKSSTTVTVLINSGSLAAFNTTKVCNGAATFFTDSSITASGTINTWTWDFGDGSPVNTTQGVTGGHIYSTPGSYNATLIVSINGSCADTVTKSVVVYFNPIAGFTYNNVCLEDTVHFTNTSSVDNSASISSYLWEFGDGGPTSTLQDPNHFYTIPGTYSVSLITSTNNGCKDSIVKSVVVHPLPVPQFSTTNVCDGIPVQFTDLSSILPSDTIQSWTWNFGDNSSLSAGQSTTHLYSAIGIYIVKLVNVSNFGCIDSISKTITVNPNPVVNFSAIDTIGCSPLCVSFQNLSFVTSGNNVQYVWNFGDGSPVSSSQDILHCYINNSIFSPSSFTPNITVTSDSGCVTSGSKNNYITVYPNPHALFTVLPETITIIDPVISITDLSTGTDFWNWNFGDASGSVSIQNPPPHTYTSIGTFTITLIATTQYNCIDTAYQSINIEPDFTFYIPNAFTPDGDGINDSFIGKGIYIKEFEMEIFDRWGNLIYKTTDLSKPWDGKANHGSQIAQADVYVYLVKVTDFKMLKHSFSGIVSLVR
jgi:gliding motility-associated-like protein